MLVVNRTFQGDGLRPYLSQSSRGNAHRIYRLSSFGPFDGFLAWNQGRRSYGTIRSVTPFAVYTTQKVSGRPMAYLGYALVSHILRPPNPLDDRTKRLSEAWRSGFIIGRPQP